MWVKLGDKKPINKLEAKTQYRIFIIATNDEDSTKKNYQQRYVKYSKFNRCEKKILYFLKLWDEMGHEWWLFFMFYGKLLGWLNLLIALAFISDCFIYILWVLVSVSNWPFLNIHCCFVLLLSFCFLSFLMLSFLW